MATETAKPAPKVGGLVYARNNVPYLQKYYQNAYKNHVRVWKINPRSRWYMRPYFAVFYGSMAATLWMAGRKVAGYNSFFGE